MPAYLTDPDAAFFDDEITHAYSRPHSPDRWRFFRLLPLLSNNEYIRGLTVYVWGNNTVGLEAHFTSSTKLSGYQNGCPIHCSLHPNERIAYVWLRIADSSSIAFAIPAIVVSPPPAIILSSAKGTYQIQTTFGRIHTFGPHILPFLVMQNKYKWILQKHKGQITALYYEKPVSSSAISRLAIISDGSSQSSNCLMPHFAACNPPIAGPNAGLFFSSASFSEIKRVELCRVNIRCTGLLIHYLNETMSVLGQWHTMRSSYISCIYDIMDRTSPEAIYFKMARSGKHQIVSEIGFSWVDADAAADVDYQNFNLEKVGHFASLYVRHLLTDIQHVAWWFSESYDVISLWEGRYMNIPHASQITVNLR